MMLAERQPSKCASALWTASCQHRVPLKTPIDLHGCDEVRLDLAKSLRSKTSQDKVRAHRKRLRQQGLRPVQIWVPDMRSPALAAEAHRQSLAVAGALTPRSIRTLSMLSLTGAQVEARGNLDCGRW